MRGEGGFLSDSRARPLMVKSVKLSPSKGIVTFLYVPPRKYRINHKNVYLLYSQIRLTKLPRVFSELIQHTNQYTWMRSAITLEHKLI